MAIILVVDDSASAREQVQSILSAAGFRVIAAPGGKHAILVLHKRTIDLIITDVYMPEGDGLEVIRSARAICPQTPILVMSGATGAMDMLKVAKCLGASATLVKPFSRAELLEAVDRILGVSGSTPAKQAVPNLQCTASESPQPTDMRLHSAGKAPQRFRPSIGRSERGPA